ncbi:MAG: hypothetical protein EOO43_15755 [Flavobacterium sp.]|nr:MAG: hypothetical protein EOO43_15755 [Flavobacterium sp.]
MKKEKFEGITHKIAEFLRMSSVHLNIRQISEELGNLNSAWNIINNKDEWTQINSPQRASASENRI